MHDLAPVADGVHRIAIFNPGSNTSQVSRLRLLNTGEEAGEVTIEGTDDRGVSPGGAVEVAVAAGASLTLTAAELESGGPDMTGALGDGAGKWRMAVTSNQPIHAQSLLSSPTGHLTNLSTAPSNVADGVHEVALFPSASDASGRQGFVRVINHADETAEITITAHDETDWTYDPLTLSLAGGEVAHFNSNDLEQGNPGKGLTGSTGAGEGDWRLELSSDTDIEVLAYIRTTDGFLTAMHDVAPVSETHHQVAIFNPGSNTAQVSRLRLVNGGDTAAEVTIIGIDDRGLSPGDELQLTLPAGTTRTYTAQQLESGGEGLEGALGDGGGKWRLDVTADQPIRVLSLLSSPTGHLTNLSTAPARDAAVQDTAAEVFGTLISPIVQSKCVTCHVEGGVSGNTRLVFVTDDDPDHVTKNFSVFETFLDEMEDGAELILNKVQGVGHGGGIQLAAGTDEFSAMERFLGLLEGEAVAPIAITPANLFDGVKMESWRSTLRRAAIVFAGRTPTEEEYTSIRGATVSEFRAVIRHLMEGQAFHEFLIRASNDRLFTDRDARVISYFDRFVDFTNRRYELAVAAQASGDDTELGQWELAVQYGIGRAPLELIAWVVENDLPYSEILTAGYVMANAQAAEAYGASTDFGKASSVHTFRPSEVRSYYRHDERYIFENDPVLGVRVIDPGPLSTIYPHAGILNTKVFLQRYPTTPTNRNRARSRWTYYHFLGVDVEESASRTTDPIALADTDNPTMNNPACTVCHSVLDPVAGAFQNYGDEGLFRDQWGGLDSLDEFYKYNTNTPHNDFEVTARSWSGRQTVSRNAVFSQGEESVRLLVVYELKAENEHWSEVALDHLTLRDAHGDVVTRYELEHSASDCGRPRYNGESGQEGYFHLRGMCPLVVDVDVPADGVYRIEVAAWVVEQAEEIEGAPARLEVAVDFYRKGDTWYHDMREPGFDGETVSDADFGLQWLAERIVADERFAEATVEFWWPAVMGREVAEPPEDASDADFEALLLASSAQASEVARLARGFRRGFRGRPSYNLKDLLVEIVLSRWFRAMQSPADATRGVALGSGRAGATRLLSPEELSEKTLSLTGFQWGRIVEGARPWRRVHEQGQSSLTDHETGYRLLYGGIDSDGVKERARDLSPVMMGVAQSHAIESACPIVMKELYLLAGENRKLLGKVDTGVSPIWEFSRVFDVNAAHPAEKETLSLRTGMRAGVNTVTLSFLNAYYDEKERFARTLRLDRLLVRDRDGRVVASQELEELEPLGDCNHPVADHFALHCSGSLEVSVELPSPGDHDIEVVLWADHIGDELPRLAVSVGSDPERSAGSRVIKSELVNLHRKLHGVILSPDSPEIRGAYDLFVDVWKRKRKLRGEFGNWPEGIECRWTSDQYYLDGVVEGAFVYRDHWGDEWGARHDWDWDRINAHFETIDWSDRHGVARTWVVVLAYLMMDYRYLYL